MSLKSPMRLLFTALACLISVSVIGQDCEFNSINIEVIGSDEEIDGISLKTMDGHWFQVH